MMEIPNVDIRRLQNLSDSIDLTIEALNQVRLSVYANMTPSAFGVMPGIGGLGHTAFDAAYADPYDSSQDTWPTI